jgi:hypothetical protein
MVLVALVGLGVFAGFGYAYLVLVKETMLKRVHNDRSGFASSLS